MRQGFIKLHRGILRSKVWLEATMECKVVFVTSLLLAVHTGNGESSFPGEFFISSGYFIDVCGGRIGHDSIYSSLCYLRENGMLSFDFDDKYYLVKISNWESYGDKAEPGWVKLHRDFLTDGLWTKLNLNEKVLMVIFLLIVNHKFNRFTIKESVVEAGPGEFITSVNSILNYCGNGLTYQGVRTCFKNLEGKGLIKRWLKGRLNFIRINSWESYVDENRVYYDFDELKGSVSLAINLHENNQQGSNKESTRNQQGSNKEATRYQQGSNKESTTNKKEKNEENVKTVENVENENNEEKNKEGVVVENIDVYEFYEKCGFGLLNAMIAEKINEDIRVFSRQWVFDAIRVACMNNKMSYSYVEGILRNWRANGRKGRVNGCNTLIGQAQREAKAGINTPKAESKHSGSLDVVKNSGGTRYGNDRQDFEEFFGGGW